MLTHMPAVMLAGMTRMLGRYRQPGLCPGSRSGRACIDCGGGGSIGARAAKRIEAREVAAEIAGELHPEPDFDHLATLGPLYDLSDCDHGCNGSPCNGDRRTFIRHPAPDE
jgi:hypothetical protein